MGLFNSSIESIYLTVLFVAGILTLLYILFGEIVEGFFEVMPISPILILAYTIFFSSSGYVLERITTLGSLWIIIISAVVALMLSLFLNIFVLVPMQSAEGSLGYTEDSLKGRTGKVIIPIPKDGFGEMVIHSKSGIISKPACSYDNEEIEEGRRVLVIDVKNGNLFVVPYDENTSEDYIY